MDVCATDGASHQLHQNLVGSGLRYTHIDKFGTRRFTSLDYCLH
jgi:hypothetical protein